MNGSFVRVLGSADWQPTKNNDHSCYTVNDRLLVDACPSVVVNLLSQDVDPVALTTVCFTHMHADHYMGLAPLLLYWRVRKGSLGEMTIVGPKETVREGFERALNFAFHDSRDISEEIAQMPVILELEGEAGFETPDFSARVMNSDHAVPGLCYRMTDRHSGHSVGFTGDTRYQPEFGAFFRDVDLLVHEMSFGAEPLNAANEICRHSGAREAVRVCRETRAKHLMLTHAYQPKREAGVALAREQLDIPVDWAMPGSVLSY